MSDLIGDIKSDRDLGTPGPWDNTGTHGLPTEFGVYAPAGRSVCSTGSYNDGLAGTYFENCCNATRIARVPAMEEALLAAVDKATEQAAEIDRLTKALKPFSDMTGELFARNREAADVVMALDNPNDMHRLTFQYFLDARAALNKEPTQ